MLLGIEIGGTKLQLGVAERAGQPLVTLERRTVNREQGAQGILQSIREAGTVLKQRFPLEHVGFGFGGPVLSAQGIVQKSHQVTGWDAVPLVEWCQRELGLPATLGNDCDVAALAEARLGAGQGARSVFYVTVGTGIGGGFVVDGEIFGRDRPALAEIGHLRPGLMCDQPPLTVEARAAGPGIAAALQRHLLVVRQQGAMQPPHQQLFEVCQFQPEQLTTMQIGQLAMQGNPVAMQAIRDATQVLGWAIAQMNTLIAPEVIVVGGGVSLTGEDVFFVPLREAVQRYTFPPLLQSYRLVPAALGEEVVVHGAIALAEIGARRAG